MAFLGDQHFHLRDLRYFEAVAEEGHVGKAAKRLNITQPAVTKAMQRLEETFGTALFERQGRRIQITPGGKLLLSRARLLCQQTDELIREINDFREGSSGLVRIGTGPISLELVLPTICSMLIKETPDVKIEVSAGQVKDNYSALKKGEFDLIASMIGETDPELVSLRLFKDELVIAARKSHPAFSKTVDMEELLKYDWALPTTELGIRRELDAAFKKKNLPLPTAQIEVNSISMLPTIVNQTELLCCLWRRQLGPKGSATHLQEIPLKDFSIYRYFGVQARKKCYLPPVAHILLNSLQTLGSEHQSLRPAHDGIET